MQEARLPAQPKARIGLEELACADDEVVEVDRATHAQQVDRQHLADLAAAEAAVQAYAGYYNLHRLHGKLGWQTPADAANRCPR